MTAALLLVVIFQAAALMVQGLLAGLALSGGSSALGLHMAVGTVSLLLAVLQVGAVLLLWRQGRGPLRLVAANLLFLAGDGVQAVAGSAHLFALHLPLGVALFGAAVALLIWSWELAWWNRVPSARRARAAIPG